MSRQVVLPLERVRALGALKWTSILVDGLHMRIAFARLAKVVTADAALILQVGVVQLRIGLIVGRLLTLKQDDLIFGFGRHRGRRRTSPSSHFDRSLRQCN